MTNSAPADDPRPTGARDGQTTESARPPCPCGCPKSSHIGEIGCPCALPGEGVCRSEYDRGYDVGYHDRSQDCGAACPERLARADHLARADERQRIGSVLDRWEGYGHGPYCTHFEAQLPCDVCGLLAEVRAATQPTYPPEQHVDRHEHDGSGCIECACNAAPWSANDCTCPGGFS